MANNQYHSLRDLSSESFNWNIKVRIVRSWRGVAKSGEAFKGLNLLLLDVKKGRMHAFVPGSVIDKHEDKLEEGTICTISNFSVKEYKIEEKFRCINSDRQIIFTNYTEVMKQDEEDRFIPKNMFDFYDLSDLADIANSNVYLTDVVGVIWKDLPLSQLKNKFGKEQTKIKFTIVDGRCAVNVTFWDSIAEEFDRAKDDVKDYPIIIIIASAKITSWQGSTHSIKQIEVSNATPTKFYLNYNEPRVLLIRKMLGTALFGKYDFSSQIPEKIEYLTIEEIQNLGTNYIQKEVVCEVKASLVREQNDWFFWSCTSCYQECKAVDGKYECYRCNDRNIPHPDKKWRFYIEAEDNSGFINIELFDREARTILGISPFDIEDEDDYDNKFPRILTTFEKKICTIKLLIRSDNIEKKTSIYAATGIYEKVTPTNTCEMEEHSQTNHMQESISQASGSTYHLDDLSQINFKTPTPETKKRLRKVTKKSY